MTSAALSLAVVMPERNGMPWLEEALASVRAQNQAVEVTVIDDGSADHTREYLGIPARG
jgi:glycosyltransferase involved in cell wall biosynthesis